MTEKELTSLFGSNIRKRRKRNKWSQEKLAEKMNVSPNTISEIETGKKFVHADTLIRFANAFGIDVYKLFKPENSPPDDKEEIIVQFSEEVKEAVDTISRSIYQKNGK